MRGNCNVTKAVAYMSSITPLSSELLASANRRRSQKLAAKRGYHFGGASVRTSWPLLPLYRRTTPSSPPAATTAPSGLTPTA